MSPDDRIWFEKDDHDSRSAFQRDRDRILYSSAFRRLAGVTQVVSPSEGHVFHNRLTHSLEVAQIARRLAERLATRYPDEAQWHGGIMPDVAEAAALAHDLGHPPFGHIAEHELDKLIRGDVRLNDGFEGNAQACRIVTKLAVRKAWWVGAKKKPAVEHHEGEFGLNLTRRTLNAVLKYPWLWEPHGKRSRKWGVYKTEQKEFAWIRDGSVDGCQSIEAAIMDWADDVAYSVHDIEDFYRAGLIPLDRLAQDLETQDAFLESAFRNWKDRGEGKTPKEVDQLTEAFRRFCRMIPIYEPYRGTTRHRMTLRSFTSGKIKEFVDCVRLKPDAAKPLAVPTRIRNQVNIVKQLVWHYVILNPALATQQYGYRKMIRTLLEVFLDASNDGPMYWQILPPRFRQQLQDWTAHFGNGYIPNHLLVRNAADAVSSFTDNEARATFQRVSGISPGSVLDQLPM